MVTYINVGDQMARGRPSRDTVYRRLNSALAELHSRFGGLPAPEEASGIWTA